MTSLLAILELHSHLCFLHFIPTSDPAVFSVQNTLPPKYQPLFCACYKSGQRTLIVQMAEEGDIGAEARDPRRVQASCMRAVHGGRDARNSSGTGALIMGAKGGRQKRRRTHLTSRGGIKDEQQAAKRCYSLIIPASPKTLAKKTGNQAWGCFGYLCVQTQRDHMLPPGGRCIPKEGIVQVGGCTTLKKVGCDQGLSRWVGC